MTITNFLKFGTFQLKVEFDFDPAEKQTRTDPGCPAEFEINSVEFISNNSDQKTDITDLVSEFPALYDYIEAAITEQDPNEPEPYNLNEK